MPNDLDSIYDKLLEGLGQRWRVNQSHTIFNDQFGFAIYKHHDQFILYYKEKKISVFNNLATAKMVSTIILNDIINYKNFDFE
jgi:hypothetical protein